jgi:outer membrane immunogenic protein
MTIRDFFFRGVVAGLALASVSGEAAAATVGQSCSNAGVTALSSDQRSLLACLYYGSHALVWTALASTPQYQPVSSSGSTDVNSAAAAQDVTAPAPDALDRWRGWFAGGNVGYAGTTNRFDNISTDVGGTATSESLSIAGDTAGLVGGYNRVTEKGLLYGGEADINYMNDAQHMNYMDGVTGNPMEAKSVWSGYGTLRGRLGFAFDPGMIFLTGGLALADVRDTYSYPTGYPIITGSSRQAIEAGWTAGAGAEFALTNQISLSVEYLHLQMPTAGNEYGSDNGAPLKFHFEDTADIARAGVNWHFQ